MIAETMKTIALVPARGGSVRIPNKNIAPLCGRPLISYTIDAAKRANNVDRIVVSTNSPEIASIAKAHGAEAPFLRPDAISGADSTEFQFLDHALDWLERNEGYDPDLIVLLYPTSPLRKAESIDRAIEEIRKHPEADSLRSVRKCSEHPYKMWMIESGRLAPFVKHPDPNVHTLSYHLLPEVYIQNASIYITRPSVIRGKRTPTGDVILPFVMDARESIDVNDPVDFLLAEAVLREEGRCSSGSGDISG
jgi:N-acylneuraminate cytidylyltransferase